MEVNITKLPFTSISRENWEMLTNLDADTLYSVIQAVGNYVLTGEKCECNDTLSKVVCGQLISVIDRKAQKSQNSANNINKRWGNKAAENADNKTQKKPPFERWLEAIRDETQNPYELFNNYWEKFFKDRESAKAYVDDYLAKFKKHLSL